MGFSLVIGYLESLTSYYLGLLLLVTGLILRFRYYVAYQNRQLTRDAKYAKFCSYTLFILCVIVLITHYIII
ncbi:CLC_0170 family protein [Brevibacillus centrosporus]|uniref:CLC_0170 family protein n=1 Tax=Brevibacillus centrosporus TaxID=54910 RepID=UPI0038247D39